MPLRKLRSTRCRPTCGRVLRKSACRSSGSAACWGDARAVWLKHLAGKLWEMRLRGRDGIARSIYVAASGQRVVVLRTFIKKSSRKPPRKEIDIAFARMRGVEGMRSFDAWLREAAEGDSDFKKEFDALEPEFALARELLAARAKAKLSQAQVAKRMGTSQSAVARIESGRTPSPTRRCAAMPRLSAESGNQTESGMNSSQGIGIRGSRPACATRSSGSRPRSNSPSPTTPSRGRARWSACPAKPC